jgi:Uma2 family endonuclease
MATVTKSILKPPITVEQWGELNDKNHYDLVAGHLKERPNVAFWHEILLLNLAVYLHRYVDEQGLGLLVSSNAKLKISKFGGREPDIFFIPKSMFRLVGKNLFKGVPPLVIEVLSPTSEHEDRIEKRREYAELGVSQYWIVDFSNRRIEVYELREQKGGSSDYEVADTSSGSDIFRPVLFPGLEIPLAKIWPTEFEDRSDD